MSNSRAGQRTGLLSSGGAVVAALLASACCWLPLALIGLGASTVGVAGFFEAYRTPLLVVSSLLLVGGFYYVYARTPTCAPGDACAVPKRTLQQTNKISLWVATFLVVVFAAFPHYVGLFIGDEPAVAAPLPSDVERTYAIVGMTCQGCVGHIGDAVRAVPGVKSVRVSYEDGSATVIFAAGQVDDEAVLAAVESAGYSAQTPSDGAPL